MSIRQTCKVYCKKGIRSILNLLSKDYNWSLIIAISIVVFVPTFVLQLYVKARPIGTGVSKDIFDLTCRFWFFASAVASWVMANNVISDLISNPKYDILRKEKAFVRYSNFYRVAIMVCLGILGCLLSFSELSKGLGYMKQITFIAIVFTGIYDWRMLCITKKQKEALRLVIINKPKEDKDKDKDKDKEEERQMNTCLEAERDFRRTFFYLDIPSAVGVFIIMRLCHFYKDFLPEAHAVSVPDIVHTTNWLFVFGMSSGAIAFEIVFVNFIYLMLFRDEQSGAIQKEPVPSNSRSK